MSCRAGFSATLGGSCGACASEIKLLGGDLALGNSSFPMLIEGVTGLFMHLQVTKAPCLVASSPIHCPPGTYYSPDPFTLVIDTYYSMPLVTGCAGCLDVPTRMTPAVQSTIAGA